MEQVKGNPATSSIASIVCLNVHQKSKRRCGSAFLIQVSLISIRHCRAVHRLLYIHSGKTV